MPNRRDVKAVQTRDDRGKFEPVHDKPQMKSTIIRKVIEHGSVIAATRNDNTLPARETIHRWMFEDPEFRDRVEKAWRIAAHTQVDMALEEAMNLNDTPKGELDKDRVRAVQHLADVRFRLAEAWNRKFGRKPDLSLHVQTESLQLGTFLPTQNSTPPRIEANTQQALEAGGITDADFEVNDPKSQE